MRRALVAMLAIALLSCAKEETATPDQAWVDAYESRNLEAIVALFTDNAIVQMDNQILSGKGQIAAYWGNQFTSRAIILQLDTPERRYDGDRIVVEGTYSAFRPRPEGIESGTYYQLWVSDGLNWYIQEERWLLLKTLE